MIGFPKLGALSRKPYIARNNALKDLPPQRKLRKSVATCLDKVVRSSNIVRRIPSISRLGFKVLRIRIKVSSSSGTPSNAKYSH